MRLVENLRKAEEKSATALRRGMDRAREEWADVERRLRQRMRVYPQKSRAMAAAAPHSGAGLIDLEEAAPAEKAPRKPIVSVNGEDLKE
jgi:phytoene/squalene synthetase